MSNKKIIALLTTSADYQMVININKLLYTEILKEFKELYIIDLQNLILFKKKIIDKKMQFKLKNINIFKPNNSLELISFFKKKKLIAFNCLGRNFSSFKIYYILNKINLTQILLLNIGYLSNTVKINKNYTGAFFFFNKTVTRYIF